MKILFAVLIGVLIGGSVMIAAAPDYVTDADSDARLFEKITALVR